MEGGNTPVPEPRYLFGMPERIANHLYDVGKATVSKVPRAAPFLSSISHALATTVWVPAGAWVAAILSLLPSISECLNPKLEAL